MGKGSAPIRLIHLIMLEVNGFEKWITLPCLEVVGIQVVAKNVKETCRRVLTAIQMGGLWSTDKHIQTSVILECVHDIIVKKDICSSWLAKFWITCSKRSMKLRQLAWKSRLPSEYMDLVHWWWTHPETFQTCDISLDFSNLIFERDFS